MTSEAVARKRGEYCGGSLGTGFGKIYGLAAGTAASLKKRVNSGGDVGAHVVQFGIVPPHTPAGSSPNWHGILDVAQQL